MDVISRELSVRLVEEQPYWQGQFRRPGGVQDKDLKGNGAMNHVEKFELHFTGHKEPLKAFKQGITGKNMYFSHVGDGPEEAEKELG